MSQYSCHVCLNLQYHLLDLGSGSSADPASPRYKAIRFPHLRAAAAAHCRICMILKRASFLFWGSWPERCHYPVDAVLFVQVRPGKSLTILRAEGDDPELTLFFEMGLRIELFTQKGEKSVHPAFGHASCVPRHLSDVAAAQRLRSWLSTCEREHDACKASPARLPSRILNISTDTARLVEFEGDDTPFGKYVTLSHCWGDSSESMPTRTTKDTLEARKRGIPSNELSTCFRDAIKLSKQAGCTYIWIDSLCIVQDDDSDWRAQSQNMAEIYSNAHFNIAATSSPNSTHSLFQDRWIAGGNEENNRYPVLSYDLRMSSFPSDPIYLRVTHERDHRYVRGSLPNLCWLQAPLMNRAWVLQEVLLSRRNLHICASELIWECKTLYDCECGQVESTSSMVASQKMVQDRLQRKQVITQIQEGRHERQAVLDFWLRLCEQYSSLCLTKPSDRAAAFAGLFKIVQKAIDGTHVAGVWVEDLPRALLWAATPRSDLDSLRCFDAPTWSWMSRRLLIGSCSFGYSPALEGFRQNTTSSVEIVRDVDACHSTVVFQGPVLSGIITKQLPSPEDDHTEFFIRLRLSSSRFLVDLDCPADSEDDIQDGDPVLCLLMGTNSDSTTEHVLLVKPCGGVDGNPYQRIGFSSFSLKKRPLGKRKSHFGDHQVHRIEII